MYLFKGSIHGSRTEAPPAGSWLDDTVKQSQLMDSDWHWLPWHRMEPYEDVADCKNKSESEDFPTDLFTGKNDYYNFNFMVTVNAPNT